MPRATPTYPRSLSVLILNKAAPLDRRVQTCWLRINHWPGVTTEGLARVLMIKIHWDSVWLVWSWGGVTEDQLYCSPGLRRNPTWLHCSQDMTHWDVLGTLATRRDSDQEIQILSRRLLLSLSPRLQLPDIRIICQKERKPFSEYNTVRRHTRGVEMSSYSVGLSNRRGVLSLCC